MTTRRRFVKLLGLGAAALAALPARIARAQKLAFPLAKAEKLQTVGGSAVLKLKGRKVLFVRDGKQSIRAFSPECTHRRCAVQYDAGRKRLQCDCHGSAFDLQGKVLAPPATAPLPTYPAELKDGKVIVDLGD